MKNLHIEDSYVIWDWIDMEIIIFNGCLQKYESYSPTTTLNRTWLSMYIEWWLHNIGYYITKPFCFIKWIKKINVKFRDVDINEWV